MKQAWTVLAKQTLDDRRDDGVQLVLIVQREGRVRQVTVSGVTWDAATVGSDVELRRDVGVPVEWPPKEAT